MVYEFKKGARVPAGITAEAVEWDRLNVKARMGKVTTKLATDAVEEAPGDFPALAAFLTWDSTLAARKQHESEIGAALASVVVLEIAPAQVRPVRAFVVVTDEDGDRVWSRTEVVLQNADHRDQLFAEIEADLRETADKMSELRHLSRALNVEAKSAA